LFNYITAGTLISNLECVPFHGAQILRSGNTFCRLLTKIKNYSILKLKSKKFFKLSLNCCGTIGIIYSSKIQQDQKLINRFAKFNIYKGRRPCVRGVAKNPIDHPHGGGQGKTSGGRTSVTP